jgi:hypothetical protein
MRTTMTPVHDARNTAQAKYSDAAVAQPLDGRTADCASEVVQALSDFGVPRRIRNRSREREQLKSLGPRGLVSSPRGYSGAMPPIANLAPESWTPRNVCALTMDKALREMEFPSRLAGAEWVVDG